MATFLQTQYEPGEIGGSISNFGEIPVYIREIRFLISDDPDRRAIDGPTESFSKELLLDGMTPPQKIEPKQSLDLSTPLSAAEEEELLKIRKAQAINKGTRTTFGTIVAFDGTSNRYRAEVKIHAWEWEESSVVPELHLRHSSAE